MLCLCILYFDPLGSVMDFISKRIGCLAKAIAVYGQEFKK